MVTGGPASGVQGGSGGVASSNIVQNGDWRQVPMEGLRVNGRLGQVNYGLEAMIRVRIEYFAILREHVGKSAEEVQTEAGTTGELFDELAVRYAFPEMNQMKVALNDEFCEWDSILTEGDAVVFIPPVAGG